MKACQDYEHWEQEGSAPAAIHHDGSNSNATQRTDISTLSHQMGVRVFEGISSQDRTSILSVASWHHYSKTTTETEQGSSASQLFLLIKGSARFFFLTPQGQKIYLIWLKSGDIFGGSAVLIDPSTYIVSTEVAKGSRAFVWQRDTLRRLTGHHPRLLENALLIASDYLTWYLATHLSLVAHSAKERLARVLMTLADGIGTKNSDGIHLAITNEQLANTSNISIFTASRILSAWQQKHVVVKRRSKIIIRSPEQLLLAS